MLRYQSQPINHWTGHKDREVWHNAVYTHVSQQLLPRLKNAQERFVEYWPARFMWGARSEHEQSISNRSVIYKVQKGVFGTGYLCITDRNIYIYSFAKLTDKYPMYRKGVMDFVFNALAQEMDLTEKSERDQYWTVPNETVLGTQVIENYYKRNVVSLVTLPMTWEILPAFSNGMDEVLAAINLARSGRLATAGRKSNADQATPTISAEATNLLRKLAELTDAGVLTEAEFVAKKREILSRL